MISRLLTLTLGATALTASFAVAEDAPAELKTAGYHLKRQSSFQAPADLRAPFWPIGWTPSAKTTTGQITAAPVQDFTLKPEQFSVTSIMLGAQSLAVINGRTYGEGEFLRTARTAKVAEGAPAGTAAPAIPANVRIRVNRIIDGNVILQAGSQAIAVPLRRPQLSEKKGGDDELLLSASDR